MINNKSKNNIIQKAYTNSHAHGDINVNYTSNIHKYNSITNKTNGINQKIFTYTSPNLNKNTYLISTKLNLENNNENNNNEDAVILGKLHETLVGRTLRTSTCSRIEHLILAGDFKTLDILEGNITHPSASPFIKLSLYILPSFHFWIPKPSFFPYLFLFPIKPKSCNPDNDWRRPPLLLSL
jgi:hypothetical protein